jgi:N-acetylglucosaminyl-diphospho-decaprenol L-rhamnosyltransferase
VATASDLAALAGNLRVEPTSSLPRTIMRHSVIIVTWNAAEVLDRCLQSVLSQEVDGGLETLVVDNASTDDTQAVLARYAERIRAIHNDRNLGFSLGNNQGAADASGEILHFLNSDTELLQRNALQRLADALAEGDVGLVGPRLVNPDGTLQPSCTAHPTVGRALVVASGLHRLLPNRILARVFPRHWSHDESRNMGWLVGAALSVRAEVFREVGGFWSIQYAEEQELAREIQRRGLAVRFVHDVNVMHVENFSNRQRWSSAERAGRIAEAEAAFLAKHYSRPCAAAIRLITASGHAGRAAILRLMGEIERADVYRSMARVLVPPPRSWRWP